MAYQRQRRVAYQAENGMARHHGGGKRQHVRADSVCLAGAQPQAERLMWYHGMAAAARRKRLMAANKQSVTSCM